MPLLRLSRLAFVATLPWLATTAVAESCGSGQEETVTKVHPVQVVIVQPVDISAYVPENTLFVVDDELAVSITDAPTTLITQLTKTSTLYTSVKE